MLRLNLQVEKVNRNPLINLNFDCWIECYWCPSSMSVSLIYFRRSTPLTILRLPKPILEFTYVTASSSLPSTIDGRLLTPMSICYVLKVMSSYCDTIAIGDTSYGYDLIWSQLSKNWFLSPRASESALSYTHRVCIGWMIAANDRTLNLTMIYWSQIYTILQLSCFPYIERRVSRATQDIWIQGHTCPDQESVVKLRVDSYKSIWLTRLRYIDYWLSALSSIWLCISWDAIIFWYWWHLIS